MKRAKRTFNASQVVLFPIGGRLTRGTLPFRLRLIDLSLLSMDPRMPLLSGHARLNTTNSKTALFDCAAPKPQRVMTLRLQPCCWPFKTVKHNFAGRNLFTRFLCTWTPECPVVRTNDNPSSNCYGTFPDVDFNVRMWVCATPVYLCQKQFDACCVIFRKTGGSSVSIGTTTSLSRALESEQRQRYKEQGKARNSFQTDLDGGRAHPNAEHTTDGRGVYYSGSRMTRRNDVVMSATTNVPVVRTCTAPVHEDVPRPTRLRLPSPALLREDLHKHHPPRHLRWRHERLYIYLHPITQAELSH
jgi:hypothetical protein